MGTIFVTNLQDSGEGSFRQAIIDSNSLPPNTLSNIVFNVEGTINIEETLPSFTNYVIINQGLADIIINLQLNPGLRFNIGSAGSFIYGLTIINGSSNGINIYSNNITLDKNTVSNCKGNGIYLNGANNNFIGINPSLASDYISNIVTKNRGSGIYLYKSDNNTLIKNYIGTLDGISESGNFKNGLVLDNSSNNIVGGTVYTNSDGITNNPTGDEGTIAPTFIVPPEGNLISANGNNGILIYNQSNGNTFYGNFVGTSSNGLFALGNRENGILLAESENNSFIGCSIVDNPFVYYNVVSGNGKNGLHLLKDKGTIIQGNFFGISADNSRPIPNFGNGILVDGSTSTTIGQVIPLGNVCSGSNLNGIHVTNGSSDFISFNTFGGLCAFGSECPNLKNGILIDSDGKDIVLRTNVWSGNIEHGIKLMGNSAFIVADPNISGTLTKGNAPLRNGKAGLYIGDNSNNNIVSSDNVSVIPNSVFSSNGSYGIEITDNAHHNIIDNCLVGLNVSKEYLLSNNKGGVKISGRASHNTISNSFISGNYGFAIKLGKCTKKNRLVNNTIGKNILGQDIGTKEGNRIIKN